MPGYPDFQAEPGWQSAPLISLFNHSFAAGTTAYGPFSANQYQGVLINHSGMPGNHEVWVVWYADQAASQLVTTNKWWFEGGQSLNVIEAATSMWFKVEVHNDTTVAQLGTLWCAQTNVTGTPGPYLGESLGRDAVIFNGPVGAGATVQTISPLVVAGRATMSLRSQVASSWRAYLQYWDSDTVAWTQFALVEGSDAGSSWTGQVTLPRASVALTVENLSTSAFTMLGTLIPG